MDQENNRLLLDQLNIQRHHIIALHQAIIHTNKKKSSKRAHYLTELLQILSYHDKLRHSLLWEEDV